MNAVNQSQIKASSAILVALCLASAWYFALCIASSGGVGLKPGHVNDFFQLWNASRAILHHEDPYGLQVAERDQLASYGETAKALGTKDDRRFRYPIEATFPLLPLGLFEFRFADRITLCIMAALVALSIGWLRDAWDGTTIVYVVLAFASYPVIVALQMRQPTLLFFGLIVGSFALLRSGRLVLAGFVAAMACGKPQIAVPVLLPMLVWLLAKWHERKRFAKAFAASVLGLLCLSSIVSPGWISEWLSSLRSYSHYVMHPSITVFLLGSKVGSFVSGVLLLGLLAALWLNRDRDLLFQIALSVAICCLLIPSDAYNAAILLIPAVWVADNAHNIRHSGPVNELVLAIVRVAFAEFWLSAALGALLMHTTSLGRSIAFWLSVNMVIPIIWSLIAMMIVQLFSSGVRVKRKLEAFGTTSLAS